MAVRLIRQNQADQFIGRGADLVSWAGLLVGDEGSPLQLPSYADRTMQVEGVFGAGGAIWLMGSSDGITYRQLQDPAGVPIAVTAVGTYQVGGNAPYIKPFVQGGDGTTALSVALTSRRS